MGDKTNKLESSETTAEPQPPRDSNTRRPRLPDLQLNGHYQNSTAASGQWRQQQLDANEAFAANSEVTAITPSRRSVWTTGLAQPDILPRETPALEPAAETQEDDEWQPSLTIGSIPTHNLSTKEAARRHMLQWDHICAQHRALHRAPSSPQLDAMEQRRARARQRYEEVVLARDDHDDKENLAALVQARVALLRETLRTTPPNDNAGAMRANITAAIEAYTAGHIPAGPHRYTLIYAGRVVDTACVSYAEFSEDRHVRLDAYLARYGPGFLWWEPPLARGPTLAKRAAVLGLEREQDCRGDDGDGGFRDDAAHYKVPLSFLKDDGLRCRRGQGKASVIVKGAQHSSSSSSSSSSGVKRKRGDSVANDDITANHPVTFNMLLDSGAELPILLHSDFALLGFGPADMNAATVVELAAAAGQTSSGLCFELLVGLASGDQHRAPALFPTRVIKLGPDVDADGDADDGGFSNDRLSGMLPFLAYYLSSAPGRDQLWLGERRVDVLGRSKMPGGLWYDPFRRRDMSNLDGEIGTAVGQLGGLGRLVFEHEVEGGRRLVDQDVAVKGKVVSRIALVEGDGDTVDCWDIDSKRPKGRWRSVESDELDEWGGRHGSI